MTEEGRIKKGSLDRDDLRDLRMPMFAGRRCRFGDDFARLVLNEDMVAFCEGRGVVREASAEVEEKSGSWVEDMFVDDIK